MIRTITAWLVACGLALATAGLGAQSRLTLVPSASVSSVFDDNIFARANATGDQMTLVTPAIEATYDTPSKMLFGGYTFDMQRSLLHPTLNYLHSRRHGILDSQFHLSSRFSLGLG